MLSARQMYANGRPRSHGTDGRPDSGHTIDRVPDLAVVADGPVVLFGRNGANIARTPPRDRRRAPQCGWVGDRDSAGYSDADPKADGLAQSCGVYECGVRVRRPHR
jgi:hypothetical protein